MSFRDNALRSLTSCSSHTLLIGGKVTIFADMLHTLTGTLDVFPGFVRVIILGLAVTFGKCPAFLLSVMADSSILIENGILGFTSICRMLAGFKVFFQADFLAVVFVVFCHFPKSVLVHIRIKARFVP